MCLVILTARARKGYNDFLGCPLQNPIKGPIKVLMIAKISKCVNVFGTRRMREAFGCQSPGGSGLLLIAPTSKNSEKSGNLQNFIDVE